MALAELAGGTLAPDGTEQTLVTHTGGKTCVLVVDLSPLVNGGVVDLRLYGKARSASAERLAFVRSYAHAQAEPLVYSLPVPANISLRATFQRVAGTSTGYVWALLSLD